MKARTPQLGDFPIDWTPALRWRHRTHCAYYPWLATVNEAYQFRMATTSLYRPAYSNPQGHAKTHSKDLDPWKALPPATVAQWRVRNLAERWATSDKTAQALAWLEHEFSDPEDA